MGEKMCVFASTFFRLYIPRICVTGQLNLI